MERAFVLFAREPGGEAAEQGSSAVRPRPFGPVPPTLDP
jgi:hypothetical protein